MNQKLLIISLFIITINFSFGQGKLERAEESLKKQDHSSRVSTSEDDNDNNDDESLGEVLFKETIGRLFVTVFAYTAYGVLVEIPNETNKAVLTKYPYFGSNRGNYSYKWNDSSAVGRTTLTSRYIFENSRIQGNHLNVDMRFYNKLGLEVDYLQLWENNPNFGYNTLAIYNALFKYHRIRTQHFNAWWGIGGTYVDGSVNQWGFTYGLGMDIFFGRPISVESNFNQTLINNNSINKFNAFINYHIKQYKLNGGYEFLKIGSQKFSTVAIGLGVSF